MNFGNRAKKGNNNKVEQDEEEEKKWSHWFCQEVIGSIVGAHSN